MSWSTPNLLLPCKALHNPGMLGRDLSIQTSGNPLELPTQEPRTLYNQLQPDWVTKPHPTHATNAHLTHL